jgi:hypothetical protein
MNHSIREINIGTKEVKTIAGGIKGHANGNRNKAQFNFPTSVCIMKDQTIIVTDKYNNCIRSINANYDVKTIAGSIEGDQDGLGFISKFNRPEYITIDTNDNIFVYEDGNNKIRKLYFMDKNI